MKWLRRDRGGFRVRASKSSPDRRCSCGRCGKCLAELVAAPNRFPLLVRRQLWFCGRACAPLTRPNVVLDSRERFVRSRCGSRDFDAAVSGTGGSGFAHTGYKRF